MAHHDQQASEIEIQQKMRRNSPSKSFRKISPAKHSDLFNTHAR
jgi:hypothetical protein